jgi:tetratricopeptide (TPR) repeat protein
MTRARPWLAPLLVVGAGIVAYANSLHGPFIFDDLESIPRNPSIRHLWPPWNVLSPPVNRTVAGRPLVNLTLAINYATGALAVEGYHVVNLVLHLANALLLWALIRRTLELPRLRAGVGDAGPWLATAIALLWVVHPLATEGVTYVIQRCELLMALFLLLTLYCVASGRHVAAVVACALGMGSKEVMVVTPLLALAYDRIFLAASFREVIEKRWRLHLGLAATWIVLGAIVAATPHRNTGFGYEGLGPLRYAATQLGVVTHYLRLAVWPRPLVVDYFDWPLASTPRDVIAPAAVLTLLGAATAWALVRRPAWGFLGLWFFLILAPTSSILPSRAEIAAERRMYLPLAAVVTFVVLGAHAGLARLVKSPRRREVEIAALALLTTAGVWGTHRRNEDYRSVEAIWNDVRAKRPGNARARINLGSYYAEQGDAAKARRLFDEALRIAPGNPVAHYNLGLDLANQGKERQAIEHYTASLTADPSDPKVHYAMGTALNHVGETKNAIDEFRFAIRLNPAYGEAHNNLGNALSDSGQQEAAIAEWREAVRVNPNLPEPHYNLGSALAEQGKTAEALAQLEEAVRLKPGFAPFRETLDDLRKKTP